MIREYESRLARGKFAHRWGAVGRWEEDPTNPTNATTPTNLISHQPHLPPTSHAYVSPTGEAPKRSATIPLPHGRGREDMRTSAARPWRHVPLEGPPTERPMRRQRSRLVAILVRHRNPTLILRTCNLVSSTAVSTTAVPCSMVDGTAVGIPTS